MKTVTKIALWTAGLLLAPPVAAQPVPASRPAAPAAPPAPPAWTVSPDTVRGTVEISATAKGGTAQFVGGCDKDAKTSGLVGAFSNYRGTGLRMDGQIDPIVLYARGEDWQDAFFVPLRYSAASRSWEIAKPLAPVFLASFARGATLAVVNGKGQEVFTFDLTGSTAAARAMRTVCGFE